MELIDSNSTSTTNFIKDASWHRSYVDYYGDGEAIYSYLILDEILTNISYDKFSYDDSKLVLVDEHIYQNPASIDLI